MPDFVSGSLMRSMLNFTAAAFSVCIGGNTGNRAQSWPTLQESSLVNKGWPLQDAAGKRAGVVAAVDDDVAVDEHGGHADRVLVRVVVGRAVSDSGRIEDRDVRP